MVLVSEKNHVESIVHNYPNGIQWHWGKTNPPWGTPLPSLQRFSHWPGGWSLFWLVGNLRVQVPWKKCHGWTLLFSPPKPKPQQKSGVGYIMIYLNMTFQRLDSAWTLAILGVPGRLSVWNMKKSSQRRSFLTNMATPHGDVIRWSHLRIEWHLCQIFISDIQQFHNGLWFIIEYPSAI